LRVLRVTPKGGEAYEEAQESSEEASPGSQAPQDDQAQSFQEAEVQEAPLVRKTKTFS